MKNKTLEKYITKLVGAKPMDYDIKPDGLLVVIDAQGRKRSFEAGTYQAVIANNSLPTRKEDTK